VTFWLIALCFNCNVPCAPEDTIETLKKRTKTVIGVSKEDIVEVNTEISKYMSCIITRWQDRDIAYRWLTDHVGVWES
jgi:hypothetical protein